MTAQRVFILVRVLWCFVVAVPASGQTPNSLAQIQASYEAADRAVRIRLLGEAARSGGGDAVAWLAQVAEGDLALGAHAALALGSMRGKDSWPELERLVKGSAPVIVRANAIRALGPSGAPGRESLFGSLVTDASQPLRIRQEAALALGRPGPGGAIDSLAAALDLLAREQTTDAEQLRISIVQALGGLRSEPARAALERHSRRELTVAERVFTGRALGNRGPVSPN